jgi:hypothetical protein
MKITREKVLDWIVPILLTGALHGLSQVMRDISKFGERLDALEQANAAAEFERQIDVTKVPAKKPRVRARGP